MQLGAMDIVGPLPESESASNYTLVDSDYLNKWAEAYSVWHHKPKGLHHSTETSG